MTQETEWIGLVSPQGKVEYNARFVVGDQVTERPEPGKWYTNQELANLAGVAHFLRDAAGSVEKGVKRWRVVRGA